MQSTVYRGLKAFSCARSERGPLILGIEGGIALIRSQNVHDHELRWNGLARISEDAADRLQDVVVEPEDILFNITGRSIPRTCVVDPDALPACVNEVVTKPVGIG